MRATIVVAIIISTLVGACGTKQEKSAEEGRLEHAHAHIKKNEYPQAIKILEEMRREKTSEQLELTLASAHAGMAGIRVEKYWEFLAEDLIKKNKGDSNETALVLPVGYQAFPKAAKKSFQEFNQSLTEFLKIVRRVEKLPYLPYEKRPDLHQAIAVLDLAKGRGARLYRGVLQTVLLRSAVQDAVSLAEAWADSDQSLCSPLLPQIVDWTEHARQIFVGIMGDFSEAFPSQNKALAEWRDRALGWQESTQSVQSLMIGQKDQTCKKP